MRECRTTIQIGEKGCKKEKKEREESDIVKLQDKTNRKELSILMNSITQDMRYRQSLINYAIKHGVSCASRKYNKNRSYIYFWLKRYDGNIESLAKRSTRPRAHPRQHTEAEYKLTRHAPTQPSNGLVRVLVPLAIARIQPPHRESVPCDA